MARDASVTLHFGDGEHLFRLRIGQLLELQDKINRPRLALMAAAGIAQPHPIGPYTLLKLCSSADLWPHELREILRIGLIGGGMKAPAADVLLHRHFATYAITEASMMAYRILEAATMGEELAPGKEPAAASAAENKPTPTQEATGSTGEPSTAAAHLSDLDRATLTDAALQNSQP